MSRTVVINGVNHGYHDFLNPSPDPIDTDGKLLFAMCLLQQAGRADIVQAVPEEEDLKLDAFEINGLGVYIKMNGREVWLKAADLGSESKLFGPVGELADPPVLEAGSERSASASLAGAT